MKWGSAVGPGKGKVLEILRVASLVLVVLVLCYLAMLALRPGLRQHMPSAVRWFGEPGSSLTITIVVAAVVALFALSLVAGRSGQAKNATVRIVVGLTVANFVLGLSSYWNCHGGANPFFYTPLMWTVGLVKGSVGDQSIGGNTCPTPTPIALEIARLSALAAILVGIGGVVIALLRSQADRIRVRMDKSVSAVVGVDDDARSMVNAVRNTLETNSRLVVVTASPDLPAVQEARQQGARVVVVDFDRPETLESLTLWRKLDRLYLLSPDPVANLSCLGMINRCRTADGGRRRVPLIVRIDDPWQAEAWRAQQFGGSDSRWAADAVGKYEVTARRLLEEVIDGQDGDADRGLRHLTADPGVVRRHGPTSSGARLPRRPHRCPVTDAGPRRRQRRRIPAGPRIPRRPTRARIDPPCHGGGAAEAVGAGPHRLDGRESC